MFPFEVVETIPASGSFSFARIRAASFSSFATVPQAWQ